MSSTSSRLEKKGFLSQLPPKANIDDYEVITINGKSGKKLKMYREKMIHQFVREERGDTWVHNDKLMKRIKGTTYSPNYFPLKE